MHKILRKLKSVKLLRDNAIELIRIIIKTSFEMGVSVHETYVHIDEIIDAYEMIGLFNKGELRTIIVRMLEEVHIHESYKEEH